MPLDPEKVKAVSDYNEIRAEKQFKKMGFRPERLDFQGPRPRPEFLVHDSAGPMLVAEVKTIHSAGFDKDAGVHLSRADPRMLDAGTVHVEVSFATVEVDLADAVRKYRALTKDRPELRGLPLAVVFFYDFFADHFGLYPVAWPEFPEVGGLLKLEENTALRGAAKKLGMAELRRRANEGDLKGLPPESKEFRLLLNTSARIPIPRHFAEGCIISNPDGQ